GHGAARRAVAGPRVARIRGTRDRRADALPAAGAGIVERAGVAVVAARAREWRHRAARRAVAGPRVALVGGAGDGSADALPAAGAGIVERAGVAVVARRGRERRHRAARRAVAGPRVALVGGARDGGADALAAAVARIVERAGVAVVARRAGVGGHGAARRAVAGAGVARIRGARDGGVVADARVTGVDGAGVPVVAVGGGRAGCAARDAGVVADAGVAGVVGAGIVVVAVGYRRAGRAVRDRRVLADAAIAGVGGAGILVVAVGGRGAEPAAGDIRVLAEAGDARVRRAGVL